MSNENKFIHNPDAYDPLGNRGKGVFGHPPPYNVFYYPQPAQLSHVTGAGGAMMQPQHPTQPQALQYAHQHHHAQFQHPHQMAAPQHQPYPNVVPNQPAPLLPEEHSAQTTPQPPNPPPSPPIAKEKEPQIVYFQEVVKMLPQEAQGPERPGSGQLYDGRFFTPKSSRKDHYFLFGSKSDYIAHFVHYYFSSSNMLRDLKLQNLLVEGGAIPVESLLLFPKLSQIETSEADLTTALGDSPKVKVINLSSGRLGVRRIDNWTPNPSSASSSGGSSTPWLEGAAAAAGGAAAAVGNGVLVQNQPVPTTQPYYSVPTAAFPYAIHAPGPHQFMWSLPTGDSPTAAQHAQGHHMTNQPSPQAFAFAPPYHQQWAGDTVPVQQMQFFAQAPAWPPHNQPNQ